MREYKKGKRKQHPDMLTYKFMLCPSLIQEKYFANILYFCRFLYNSALAERNAYYKKYGKGLSYKKQAAELAEVKALFPEETAIIYSQTLQQVLIRLKNTFSNFFRRVKNGEKPGYPRFKGANNKNTICFPQADLTRHGVKLLPNGKLEIYGIPGEVKVKWHREIKGICRQVKITKQNGKYYICVVCSHVPKKALRKTGLSTGIDLGIKNFATLDDGTQFHHPKPYKTAKEKLAFLQRKLETKKRLTTKSNSNNIKKAKRAISNLHEKIVNIRDDFQHKLALKLVTDYDTICMEKLDIASMLESEGYEVNKENIQEASWGKFVEKVASKAGNAGKLLVKVEAAYSSTDCSNCDYRKTDLKLSDRTYKCDCCGLEIDRDINAAKNVLRRGMRLVTLGVTEAPDFSRG